MTRALVFLDLSDMDQTLMQQIAGLNKVFEIEKLYVAHYIELQEFSGDLNAHFQNMEWPIEEILHEELMDRAKDSGLDTEKIAVLIFKDGSKKNMTSWINESDVDVCVLGKKIVYKGTGIFSGRMARLLTKNILFTTETSRLDIRHTLVAVDFSSFSKRALKFALRLQRQEDQVMTAYHVFRLPGAYFPFVRMNSEKLEDKQTNESLNKLRKFVSGSENADQVDCVVEFAGSETLGKKIYDFAKSHFVDLVVMGVKGKTNKDNLLIGSVAEQLIAVDKDLPVLLVKN